MTEVFLDFGQVLRSWRQHRRVSQLKLATASGISQRHISFLETGRSSPSRGMVLALSDSLNIPLRERNALLQSAGFRSAYDEQPLDDQSVALFRQTLEVALKHHEPYPALVLDGRWNIVMANNAATRFFSLFIDLNQALRGDKHPDFQLIRICLAPDGLKPYINNWESFIYALLQRARRALLINPRDPGLPQIIESILSHPDAPEQWHNPAWSAPVQPVMPMQMTKNGNHYSLFTMLAHFGAPQHVTIEELSVETLYPADEPTRRHLEALAER